MGRFLPIQILLAIILIAVSGNLAALFYLLQQQGQSRAAYAGLSEQRLGVSKVIFAIEDRADQLQRLARLAAASGELSYVKQHKTLRLTIAQFRDLIATPAPAHAAMPDLSDPDLSEWLGSLANAQLSDTELEQLHAVLNQIHEWSAAQAHSIAVLVAGHPDEVVLMDLASPTQELANWRNSALIEELEYQVLTRLDGQGANHQSRIETLRRYQLMLLATNLLIMVAGMAGFQRQAVVPLKKLLEAATQIGGGAYETRIKPSGVQEIRDISATLNWMADAIEADISARLAAEERAQEMEARVREVGDLSPGSIWSILFLPDQGPRATYISKGFNELFALGADAVFADFNNLFACIHPGDRRKVRALVDQSQKDSGELDIEYRTLRPDGEYRWTRSVARVRKMPRGEMRWNGFSMDIHELKLLRETNEDALRRARAASDAKSAFLANMSHEVRTPLNAIIGIADLALSEDHTAPLLNKFRRISDAGQNLLQLLNDVLDSSKLEAGQMQLQADDFSLQTLFNTLFDLHVDGARSKGLVFETLIEPGTATALQGDPLRLQQTLSNLLSNAIKFTASGRIELRARPGATPAMEEDERCWLEISVHDTGPGIPDEQVPELFEPFTQQDASTSRAHGGTGLGLSIVQQLVELMDGHVSVSTKLGQGSRFLLLIPFALGRERTNPVLDTKPLAQVAAAGPAPTEEQNPLTPEQSEELLQLIEAGDATARQRIQDWFGRAAPASLSALQKDLDGFDFEQASRRLHELLGHVA